MTMDDDDLEDPAFGSLREVVHGMRDEEPSDRGLATLMAAARAQAEVMKPAPSWWERLLVTLRRPPVLALASGALLVGGGLVISRHASDLDATSTAPAAPAPASDTAVPAATLAGSAAAPGAGSIDQPTSGSPEPATPTPDTTEGGADPVRPRRPAAAAGTAPMMPTSTDGISRDDGRPRRRATGPSVRPSDLAPEAAQSPRSAPASEEASANDAASTGGPATSTTPATGRALLGDDEIDRPVAAPVTPRAATAAQLQDWVTRCEQAAVRGDCATVRTLARQVEAAAPSVFRARLVGNGAVARCLAP